MAVFFVKDCASHIYYSSCKSLAPSVIRGAVHCQLCCYLWDTIADWLERSPCYAENMGLRLLLCMTLKQVLGQILQFSLCCFFNTMLFRSTIALSLTSAFVFALVVFVLTLLAFRSKQTLSNVHHVKLKSV